MVPIPPSRLCAVIAKSCFFLAASVMLLAPHLAKAEDVPARNPEDFLESIGANAHWNYPNVYQSRYTEIKTKMAEMGLRHLRAGTSDIEITKQIELYNELGIKATVNLAERKSGPWPQPLNLEAIPVMLQKIKDRMPHVTIGFEGPNEYDISHGSGEPDWVGTLRTYVTRMANQIRNDPVLKSKHIVGPSLTSVEAYSKVGNLSSWVDYSCLHLYQSNRHPGNTGWGSNGYGSIPWAIKYCAEVMAPGKGVIVTECGYSTQTHGTSHWTNERTDGLYTPRMFLEFYRVGWPRQFKYEFVNQGTKADYNENNFGFLRNDLSEKPSFVAMKNLMNILSDSIWDPVTKTRKGGKFPAGKLDYTTAGATSSVRQMLFQKSDGNFYLVIWNEVPSWHVDELRQLDPAPVNVTLSFVTPIAEAATCFPNDNRTFAVKSISSGKLALSVTDRVQIVRLKPQPPANVLPSVSITNPANGAVLTGGTNLTVRANATDSDGTISRVQFFRGTMLLKSDTTSPFSVVVQNLAAGNHSFVAKAFDNLGASKMSSEVNVIVKAPNAAPAVNITSPANSAVIAEGKAIRFIASASDSDGSISRVAFLNNGSLFHTEYYSPYDFKKTLPAGTHAITVRAFDNQGASALSAPINLTVNKLPVVSISKPASGSTFAAGTIVNFQALATDADGSIKEVLFYVNGVQFHDEQFTPYLASRKFTTGTYAITARAFDNHGHFRTSAPVSITVK
jgi:hypothetical protein